ncbi:hypothetical protein THRCLA_20297 [Thraustotheca clavata]|uniref:Secreted protein n=1 Tax=Thraustotheca clavata TaxID=74557 RepID=A0A1W0A8Z6_9STRA|nr:hypothetical protein THRCLA_20297 [Thraustotheca clavata]
MRSSLLASAFLPTVLAKLTSFYVCDSSISMVNGLYELDDAMESNDAVVYSRVDGVGDSLDHDFRLFRHHGFWSFGDFEQWPPEVYFRCDPFYSQEVREVCLPHLDTPPMHGYTPRQDPTQNGPVLQVQPCNEKDEL